MFETIKENANVHHFTHFFSTPHLQITDFWDVMLCTQHPSRKEYL